MKGQKHENIRSRVVKKNILLSILFKGSSILISFLLLPISIKFVGKDQFGVWLTISSVVTWLSLLDIGLTYGLRNNLVQALSLRKFKLAKVFVSTTYVVLGGIFLCLILIFMFINPFIDWASLLKLSPDLASSLSTIVAIIFSYFCLSFLLKMINTVLFADQKAGFSAFIDMLGQLMALLAIFLMTLLTEGSLYLLCLGMCVMPIFVALVFNWVLFRGRYKLIAPSIKYFRVWCIRRLMGLSVKFFVIQIAAVIQYQTANVLIARLFSVGDVTVYNISFKYFSILTTLFGMILLPIWSAATDAYHQNDFEWIRKVVSKYLKILAGLTLVGIVMLLLSNYVYYIWIDKWLGKDAIDIPFSLSFWCLIYVIVNMFGSLFVSILNGIGAVRIQLILSVFTPFLYLGVCLLLVSHFSLGVYAMFVAAVISNVNGFIIAPLQYFKIFVQKRKGIWIE